MSFAGCSWSWVPFCVERWSWSFPWDCCENDRNFSACTRSLSLNCQNWTQNSPYCAWRTILWLITNATFLLFSPPIFSGFISRSNSAIESSTYCRHSTCSHSNGSSEHSPYRPDSTHTVPTYQYISTIYTYHLYRLPVSAPCCNFNLPFRTQKTTGKVYPCPCMSPQLGWACPAFWSSTRYLDGWYQVVGKFGYFFYKDRVRSRCWRIVWRVLPCSSWWSSMAFFRHQ